MIIYDGTNDSKLCRTIFRETMEAIAEEDKDVVYVDCDMMNSIDMLGFGKENKKQAINAGIAEADAAGIAAGLSAGGLKPYVHTFASFASRRCFDQSFLSIAYAGNSVRIIGSDCGVTTAFNGGTHMAFEDIALYRVVPGSTVIENTDSAMLGSLLRLIKDRPGLTYLRTTRKAYSKVYSADHPFEIGKGELLKDGSDITIFAIGVMVSEALKTAYDLEKEGISVRVVDMYTIKPLDLAMVKKCAEETKAFITAEDHNIIGGLGDAVIAGLQKLKILKLVKKVGVEDRFGSVGSQAYLQEYYGLTAIHIAEEVRALLK